MIDPLSRAEIERDIATLADPELTMACGVNGDKFSIMFVRRRGAASEPGFRFRDPDRA